MLTKTDLQQIRSVIRNEVDDIVDTKLKPIKKDLRYIRKTVDVLVNRTDVEDVKLQKRVIKIEEHLRI